jgi:hypothetical protein
MRKFIAVLMLLSLTIPTHAKLAPRNPFPNELNGFEFYVKYLAPLRPYASDHASVVHVLGSDQGMAVSGWRISPLCVGKDNKVNSHPWVHDVTGRLASIEIIPKQRVPMLGVKFPPAFTHSLGSVSEINLTCDVYSDDFGLQYWLYAEDSVIGKKGDLMKIEYGPSDRIKRQVVGPS